MPWNKYKYIYFGLLLVFLISGGLSFYWAVNSQPQDKPRISVMQEPTKEIYKISKETKVIYQEKYSTCVKYDLNCSVKENELIGEKRDHLNGLTLEEIKKLYSIEENKTINTDVNAIYIISWKEGICSEHKNILHLGVNDTDNFVTVYYGPGKIKDEGGIYKVTEIPINDLPPQYQDKVKAHTIEFYQEEELIATLDSFSEFLD